MNFGLYNLYKSPAREALRFIDSFQYELYQEIDGTEIQVIFSLGSDGKLVFYQDKIIPIPGPFGPGPFDATYLLDIYNAFHEDYGYFTLEQLISDRISLQEIPMGSKLEEVWLYGENTGEGWKRINIEDFGLEDLPVTDGSCHLDLDLTNIEGNVIIRKEILSFLGDPFFEAEDIPKFIGNLIAKSYENLAFTYTRSMNSYVFLEKDDFQVLIEGTDPFESEIDSTQVSFPDVSKWYVLLKVDPTMIDIVPVDLTVPGIEDPGPVLRIESGYWSTWYSNLRGYWSYRPKDATESIWRIPKEALLRAISYRGTYAIRLWDPISNAERLVLLPGGESLSYKVLYFDFNLYDSTGAFLGSPPDVNYPLGSWSQLDITSSLEFGLYHLSELDERIKFYGIAVVFGESEVPPNNPVEFINAWKEGRIKVEKSKIPAIFVGSKSYIPVLDQVDIWNIGTKDYKDFYGPLRPIIDEVRQDLTDTARAVWDTFFGPDLTMSFYEFAKSDSLQMIFMIEDSSTGKHNLVILGSSFEPLWKGRYFECSPLRIEEVDYVNYGDEELARTDWTLSVQCFRTDDNDTTAGINELFTIGIDSLTSSLVSMKVSGEVLQSGLLVRREFDYTEVPMDLTFPVSFYDNLKVEFVFTEPPDVFDFEDFLELRFLSEILEISPSETPQIQWGRRHADTQSGRIVPPAVGLDSLGLARSLEEVELSVPVRIFDIDEDLFNIVPADVSVLILDNFVNNLRVSGELDFTTDPGELLFNRFSNTYKKVYGVRRIQDVLDRPDKYVRGAVSVEVPPEVYENIIFTNVQGLTKDGKEIFIEGKVSDLTSGISKEEALKIHKIYFWMSIKDIPQERRVPITFRHRWWVYDDYTSFISDESAQIFDFVNTGYLDIVPRGNFLEARGSFYPEILRVLDYTDYFPIEINPAIYTYKIELKTLDPAVSIGEVWFDIWRATEDIQIWNGKEWIVDKTEAIDLLNSLIDRSSTALKQTLEIQVKIRPRYFGLNFGVIDPGAFMQNLRPQVAIPYVFINSRQNILRKVRENYAVKKEVGTFSGNRIPEELKEAGEVWDLFYPTETQTLVTILNSSKVTKDITAVYSPRDIDPLILDQTVYVEEIPPKFLGVLKIKEALGLEKYNDIKGGIVYFDLYDGTEKIDTASLPIPGYESYLGSINFMLTAGQSQLTEAITFEAPPKKEPVKGEAVAEVVWKGPDRIVLAPGQNLVKVPVEVNISVGLDRHGLRELADTFGHIPESLTVYIPVGIVLNDGTRIEDASGSYWSETGVSATFVDPLGGPYLTVTFRRTHYNIYSGSGGAWIIVDSTRGLDGFVVGIKCPAIEDLCRVVFTPKTNSWFFNSYNPFNPWDPGDLVKIGFDSDFRSIKLKELDPREVSVYLSVDIGPDSELVQTDEEKLLIKNPLGRTLSISCGTSMKRTDLIYEDLQEIKRVLDKPWHRLNLLVNNLGRGGTGTFSLESRGYSVVVSKVFFNKIPIGTFQEVPYPAGVSDMDIYLAVPPAGSLTLKMENFNREWTLLRQVKDVKIWIQENGVCSLRKNWSLDVTQGTTLSILATMKGNLIKIFEESYILDSMRIVTNFPGDLTGVLTLGENLVQFLSDENGIIKIDLPYSKHSLDIVPISLVLYGTPNQTGEFNFDILVRELKGGIPKEKILWRGLLRVFPPHVLDDEYILIECDNLDYSRVVIRWDEYKHSFSTLGTEKADEFLSEVFDQWLNWP